MTIFALVDCNNFYASCERVFNPALEKKPIVVLSNNDGCIIARSNEAKQLGIPMGTPFYPYEKILQQQGGVVLSSNYELYGDMSQRVMNSLQQFCPEIEVYSIDEAFLQWDKFEHGSITDYALAISKKIKQWTGLSVSIGIGPTKTLAKIANHFAKKNTHDGVFTIMDPVVREYILSNFEVGEIWGVGYGRKEKLAKLNITTAKALRDANPKHIRKHLTVMGERMVHELRGVSCLPLETLSEPRKNILSSRSFGRKVTALHELEEAVANYTARACEKLRKQNSRAQSMYVFIQTNPYKENMRQYRNSHNQRFIAPTCDTREIVSYAKECLKNIYQEDIFYKKIGVVLMDLVPDKGLQQDLFFQTNYQKSDKIMGLVDNINLKMGKNKLFLAAQGIERSWSMRCDKRSLRCTTHWDELALVY